jgi:hypothetical protein
VFKAAVCACTRLAVVGLVDEDLGGTDCPRGSSFVRRQVACTRLVGVGPAWIDIAGSQLFLPRLAVSKGALCTCPRLAEAGPPLRGDLGRYQLLPRLEVLKTAFASVLALQDRL